MSLYKNIFLSIFFSLLLLGCSTTKDDSDTKETNTSVESNATTSPDLSENSDITAPQDDTAEESNTSTQTGQSQETNTSSQEDDIAVPDTSTPTDTVEEPIPAEEPTTPDNLEPNIDPAIEPEIPVEEPVTPTPPDASVEPEAPSDPEPAQEPTPPTEPTEDPAPVEETNTTTVVVPTPLENALALSDASLVSETTLLTALRKELALLTQGDPLLATLYQNESIAYDPSNRSQLLEVNSDAHTVFPILIGNKSKTLAVAGYQKNSRFAAYGAAPTEAFADGNNLGYQVQFKRLLSWLLQGEELNAQKTVALSFTQSDTSNIKDWLSAQYPNITLKECHDVTTLTSCYAESDLVILSWQTDASNADAIALVINDMLIEGKPLLYLHTWYEAMNEVSERIAKLLGFSLHYGGNYWSKDKANWDNYAQMQQVLAEAKGYAAIDTVAAHFQANDYAFTWSQCDGENCSNVPNLAPDFQTGATTVRSMLKQLAKNEKAIFNLQEQYKLEKLLILLGDKYRQNVHFPMDKVSTDDNTFMRSYYADHALYNLRSVNPTQPDMGNFSRSDFSSVTAASKSVTLSSKKPFKATGAYALPGKSVTVTRTDHSDLDVYVFINTLRSGATHQYATDGYKRPKYLQTPYYKLKSGEPLVLTSCYGGPIQLAFSKNNKEVSVQFEHIGEHPFWASSADDASFTAKINEDKFDWAEIVTAGFEVHSKLDKMQSSITNWNTASQLAAATVKYISNYPLVLAGFRGPGIDEVSEIIDFAHEHNLTMERSESVKHMNADQATCGYGCSGNPYDAYWAFSPVGHGDIHEVGHGLERSRFRFSGWSGHSVTNPYSYYTKSMYHKETSEDPACQNLPFKEVFEAVQASQNEDNATAYLQEKFWATSGWSQQFMVTLQAMMHAQKMGKLDNGWHLLARLHTLEREAKRAIKDWENRKSHVGFTSYSLSEFEAVSNNDWMLVSLSFAAELDFRDYLTMMGISFTQKADAQVGSFNFENVPQKFFVSTPNGYCKEDSYGSYLDKQLYDLNSSFPY